MTNTLTNKSNYSNTVFINVKNILNEAIARLKEGSELIRYRGEQNSKIIIIINKNPKTICTVLNSLTFLHCVGRR